jgi:hypothetical protein
MPRFTDPITLEELMKMRFTPPSFVHWELVDDRYLTYSPMDYQIDLYECVEPSEILDWIVQIKKKVWASDSVLAELVRAFDFFLRLQEHFCPGGKNRPQPATKIKHLIETAYRNYEPEEP